MKTAEELCKRTLKGEEDKKVKGFSLTGDKDERSNIEEGRKKNKMKERKKLKIWDPAWRNQMRIQILGEGNLIVNWINRKWKINCQKF